MNYIIIGLLAILIILVLILIIKQFKTKENNNESKDLIERLGRFEVNINKEMNEFKGTLSKELKEDFEKLNDKIEKKLTIINDKVNERLDQNFEKTNKTFNNVLERLSKIDEAQKKIEVLSNDIVSLQSVLTDKKTRGIFGEVNLAYILSSVFGENNKKVYSLQEKLPNGYYYEFWFKLDKVQILEHCGTTAKEEYILFSTPHSIYLDLSENKYYYKIIDSIYSSTLDGINNYEWNKIVE